MGYALVSCILKILIETFLAAHTHWTDTIQYMLYICGSLEDDRLLFGALQELSLPGVLQLFEN